VFVNFLKKLSKHSHGKTILMDNAAIHRSKEVKAYLLKKSQQILYNVPYNPETNPIEQMFGKCKNYVRKTFPQTLKQLESSITQSLKQVTPENLSNYFKHSFK